MPPRKYPNQELHDEVQRLGIYPLKGTKTFPEAPQRESFESDAAYFEAERAHALELIAEKKEASMEKPVKCVRNKSFCQSLLERADPHAAKGLKIINIYNIKKPSLPLIYTAMAYKQNAKDRGLMLNYCPFCGGDIQNWEKFAGKK